MSNFLTAEWRNLVLVTYAVPPEMLAPYLPPGLTLDSRADAPGMAFLSLVAFDFLNTKVLGIPWPGYRNFPEVNLRFYVRERLESDETRRGVVFVEELVPKRLIANMAKWLYNEPYSFAPMQSKVKTETDSLHIQHSLERNNVVSTLHVECETRSETRPADSMEHFFKEHSWGYGTSRKGKLLRYEVRHPEWRVHPVKRVDVNWDFASVYGEKWAHLKDLEPYSVVVAEGSAISVSPLF